MPGGVRIQFLFFVFLVMATKVLSGSTTIHSIHRLRGGAENETAVHSRLPKRVKSLTSQLQYALRSPSTPTIDQGSDVMATMSSKESFLPDLGAHALNSDPAPLADMLLKSSLQDMDSPEIANEDPGPEYTADTQRKAAAGEDSGGEKSGGQRCAGCKLRFDGAWIMGFDRPHCSEPCLRVTQKRMDALDP